MTSAYSTYARQNVSVNPHDREARSIDIYDPAIEWEVHLRLPSPAHVARFLVARHMAEAARVYRDGPDAVIGDRTLEPADVVAYVRDVIDTMPDRPTGYRELGVSNLYRGLRDYARLAHPDDLAGYIADIAAAVPATLRPRPVKKPTAPRPAPMTGTERKAASRARIAERERDTVAAYLRMFADEENEPMSRVDLFDGLTKHIEEAITAKEEVEEEHEGTLGKWEYQRSEARRLGRRFTDPQPVSAWPDVAAEYSYPIDPRLVARRRARELFLELGMTDGPKRHGVRTYAFPTTSAPVEQAAPKENPVTTADHLAAAEAINAHADALERLDLIERQRLAFASGDIVGALEAHRERTRPGVVVDAADRFTRRKIA